MRLVSYDCERMKYFLPWRTDGVSVRDIRPRINKNLERIDTMLQALATACRLKLFGLPAMNSQFISPIESRIARKRLADFKRLFPVEVEKTPPDKPVYLLVETLHMLCAAIALDPLYAETFERAAGLMKYLQREDLAGKFQQVTASLEQGNR